MDGSRRRRQNISRRNLDGAVKKNQEFFPRNLYNRIERPESSVHILDIKQEFYCKNPDDI